MARFKSAGVGLLFLLSMGAGLAAARKMNKLGLPGSLANDLELEVDHELVLFYATDRSEIARRTTTEFGSGRSDQIKYGRFFTPAITTTVKVADRSFSANKFVPLSEDEFAAGLNKALAKRDDKRVVVFVPGYDMNFEKSMKRGFMIAHATKLPVVVFSWPSVNNSFAYSIDECNAEWSSAHLAELLRSVKISSDATAMSIIGHSLGCRVVPWALQHLAAHGAFVSDADPYLEHLILCSPDMDTDTFANYAVVMARASLNSHVLASSIDLRLKISSLVHGRSRLGVFGFHKRYLDPPSVPGVHTIDFTAIDPAKIGHSIPYQLISSIIHGAPFPEGLGTMEDGVLEAEFT